MRLNGSTAPPYADKIVSVGSSTNIDLPLDLHGWSFRHAQGRLDEPVSVEERLGPAVVAEMVADFEAGTAKWKLAARHGISESSVKRLLRRHRHASGSVDAES